MGKKSQLRAQRKDKFYQKAKLSGFRARSAYKLIQLNERYEFLQNSRVCLDLCAAPGSWMQVAARYMPVSSVIIGVDLNKIAPIPRTITIKGDITSERTFQDIKSTLKTWKVDVVLHDGSPNVAGDSYSKDALEQNILVLHAFRIACNVLKKGGWFATKIFRSRDHTSLEFVFRQFFKKVEMTKPEASRLESAETFIICNCFLAPDKVDPKFFDPHHVFMEIDQKKKMRIRPESMKRPAALGYKEGITMFYKKMPISRFLTTGDYLEVLEEATEFEIDIEGVYDSKHTTKEILEYLKDIKVLGRREIRDLLKWRQNVKEELMMIQEERKRQKEDEEREAPVQFEDEDEDDEDMQELARLTQELQEYEAEQKRAQKKKKKKIEQEVKHLRDKVAMQMLVMDDYGPEDHSKEYFRLSSLDMRERSDLDVLVDQPVSTVPLHREVNPRVRKAPKERFTTIPADNPRILHSSGAFSYTNEQLRTVENLPDEFFEEMDRKKETNIYDMYTTDLNLKVDSDEEHEVDETGHKRDKGVMDSEDESEGSGDPPRKRVKWKDNLEEYGPRNPLLMNLTNDTAEGKNRSTMDMWFDKDVFHSLDLDDITDYELESSMDFHRRRGGKIMTDVDKSSPHMRKLRKKERAARRKLEKKLRKNGALLDEEGSVKEEEANEAEIKEDNSEVQQGNKDEWSGDDASSDDDDEEEEDGEKKKSIEMKNTVDDAPVQPDYRPPGIDSSGISDDDDSEDDKKGGERMYGPEPKSGAVVGALVKRRRLSPKVVMLARKMMTGKKKWAHFLDTCWNRYMKGKGEEELPDWFGTACKHYRPRMSRKDNNELKKAEKINKAKFRSIATKTIKKAVEAKARKLKRLKKAKSIANKKAEAVINNAEMSAPEKMHELKRVYKRASNVSRSRVIKKVVIKKKNVSKMPQGIRGRFVVVDKRMKKDLRGEKKRTKKPGKTAASSEPANSKKTGRSRDARLKRKARLVHNRTVMRIKKTIKRNKGKGKR